MQLQDFYDYKNQLAEDILTSEELVKLIDSSVSPSDAKSLMYRNVFPYEYLPETADKGRTFICIDVDIQKALNKTYLVPVIYVWVFAHKSRLRLPNGGGVLTDKICSEICKLINGSRNYGLGELDLYSVKRFAPMTDYQGKMMTFSALEFNRLYDYAKHTPANRKGN